MKGVRDSRGFTLVEILAAFVIISIILLSFYKFFIQTNETAAKNNEKLVTINLADAVLAKVQAKTYPKLESGSIDDYFKDTTETDPKLKDPPLKIEMNGKTYNISYTASQESSKVLNSNYSEKDLNLIKVVVTVTAPDGKTNASSEGYIRYE